jgi:hypothetical protein
VNGDAVRVTFGVAPAWLLRVAICISFVAAVAQTAVPIYLYWRLTSLFSSIPGPATTQMSEIKHSWLVMVAQAVAISALTWWPASLYQLYMYRKWGRVPKTIEVSAGKFIVKSLGWWRLRTWERRTLDVTSIELCPRKNLWPFATSADLVIHFRDKRRARFRLNSTDSTLPRRIREALATAIARENSPIFRGIGLTPRAAS